MAQTWLSPTVLGNFPNEWTNHKKVTLTFCSCYTKKEGGGKRILVLFCELDISQFRMIQPRFGQWKQPQGKRQEQRREGQAVGLWNPRLCHSELCLSRNLTSLLEALTSERNRGLWRHKQDIHRGQTVTTIPFHSVWHTFIEFFHVSHYKSSCDRRA